MSLNKAQCHLEGAIGTLKKAATVQEEKGNTELAIRLMQHAIDIAALRDPEHVTFLERRRLRRVEAERKSA